VRLQNRIPAVWLVISGIISVQFGAAIAKNHFQLVQPTAIVCLRLITSAVILLIMARPRLMGHSGRDWLIVLGFGVSLMTVTWAIYHSFAQIPLGIAVTIAFLGPLTVAVIGSRRLTDLIWGGARWHRSCSTRFVKGNPDNRGGWVRSAGSTWMGLLHPAERPDWSSLAWSHRPCHGHHGGSHRSRSTGNP
jgi:inner membrane transporter RhtA